MKKILIAIALLFVASTSLHADTYLQRIATLCGALVDGTCTVGQKTALVNAYVAHYRGRIIELGHNPDTLTDAKKAAAVLVMISEHSRELIKIHDAGVGTAIADVKAARATAATTAETNIPIEAIE
jgi:hypothetical protein